MTVKKIFAALLIGVSALTTQANGLIDDAVFNVRLGYSLGGMAPVGLPNTIRSLDSYHLRPNFVLGLDMNNAIDSHWGWATGIRIERKGMYIDATVKNYHMVIERGGQALEGYYTGHEVTEAKQLLITVPVQATYNLCQNLSLRLGPYVSFVMSKQFDGYVYDGYLRVNEPTGDKVVMGNTIADRGSYDFSDRMRSLQYGIDFGVDWCFYHQVGAFAELSWGLNSIHHSDFKTIEQKLYPIYGTIGLTYRIK